YAALAFAVRHPTRVGALILADTRAGADSAETRKARDGAIGRIKTTGSGPYLDGSLARLLSPSAPAELVRFLRARAETREASLIAGIEALRDRPDRTGDLGAIRVPTLVVRGSDDQVTPAADMQQMSGAIAGATFVSIPGAGHLSHIEAPEAFGRALTSFLGTALNGEMEKRR
ncbi:MAG TPA: alpha/beta fold hydrolase, partial [Polyangia bacterium]|nr:alpha/beta fold hydrolase [Polyangia bacterium]